MMRGDVQQVPANSAACRRLAALLLHMQVPEATGEAPSPKSTHDRGEELWGVGQNPEQISLSRRVAGLED